MNVVSVLLTVIALVGVAHSSDCLAGDRAQPSSVASSHQFNPSTHLYAYSYTLVNPAGSQAPLDTLVIKLEPGVDVITNMKAPPGWRAIHAAEKGMAMWAATGFLDPDAEDPSGNIPPSDYAVLPGASLGGFSFESFSPPGSGVAITQAYAPLYMPQSDEEFETLETSRTVSTLPDDNGYQLAVTTPVPNADWTGNRRPAVDGFLVFANVQDKAAFQGSALIVIRLASGGETVHPSTLNVLLNSVDVTGSFAWSTQYNGYAAAFAPGTSPVRDGTNVLRTSIEGIVPGTEDRIATDTDRLTFDFIP